MASIGIRVTPNEIYYSIVNLKDSGYEIITISCLKIPKALDVPCKLSYIRNILNTLIKQYGINKAGVKLIEGNARNRINASTFFRLNVEGVIQEVFANSSIEKYLLGIAPNISAILEVEPKPVKDIAEDLGVDETIVTDEGKKLNDNNKESLVVAVAALI